MERRGACQAPALKVVTFAGVGLRVALTVMIVLIYYPFKRLNLVVQGLNPLIKYFLLGPQIDVIHDAYMPPTYTIIAIRTVKVKISVFISAFHQVRSPYKATAAL